MKADRSERRTQARRLFLAGDVSTNTEIAAQVGVKPHTVGEWRKKERWDDLRRKIDIRAAELFVERIATDTVTLNVRHYRMWDLLLARLAEDLKAKPKYDIRDMEKIAGILDRAQKGQRLAKGLSLTGETEEAIRAQSQAELRRFVDAFTEAVKENVDDEETRERIRRAVIEALPDEADDGAGESSDPVPQRPAGRVGREEHPA